MTFVCVRHSDTSHRTVPVVQFRFLFFFAVSVAFRSNHPNTRMERWATTITTRTHTFSSAYYQVPLTPAENMGVEGSARHDNCVRRMVSIIIIINISVVSCV
uniref:Putative secreted protein n=1 Tax=Anopheles darlingi TaxID=43151 RepID=A0A2M4D0R0_ANODA